MLRGLIDVEESSNLVLALEPESAAIACEVHKLAGPGDSFMVLDTGGGTVDITLNRCVQRSPQPTPLRCVHAAVGVG